MKARARFTRLGRSERLRRRASDVPPSYWTVALGRPPSVYGERTVLSEGETLRRWDPSRSKLGAALAKGWTEPLPKEGERWLYLGGASGTTASHVADLLGPPGAAYVVERSLRPFAALVGIASRYPNLGPILADARRPDDYLDRVPMVDGLYADIAQPDQVEIASRNAVRFLRDGGPFLLALKTASMGRDRSPRDHLARARQELSGVVDLVDALALEPFHRQHFLLAGRLARRAALGPPEGPRHRPTERGYRAGRGR